MSDTHESKRPVVTLPENVLVDYVFEKMLKQFIKQIQKEGILQEVKDRRCYIKPSEAKRNKKKEIERKYHIKRKWKSK